VSRHAWRALALGALATCGWLAPAPGIAAQASAPADIRRDATVDAVEKVMPSVVNIGTKTRQERRGLRWDWFRENWELFTQQLPPQESAGSGVIIDEEGYILTNAHVVDGADKDGIWARLSDGRILQAELVTGARKSDVALLKLRARPSEKFQTARFAADNDTLLGETVIALGNPFGLGGSVSRGILSSRPRRPETDDEPLRLPDWLQTDAAINPGNSGGPLINLRGEIIGINNAVFRAGQGIGFAIPVKRVVEAVSDLIAPETTNKQLWFGARLRPGSQPLRVEEVQAESPAAKAGLQVGDLLLRVNGQAQRSFFAATIALTEAGEKGDVTLAAQRGSEPRTVTVRMVPLRSHFNSALVQKKLGFGVEELTPTLAESLGYNPKAGLVIRQVETGSAADRAGLKPGMLLRAVDGVPTTDIVETAKLANARKAGDRVRLDLLIQQQRGTVLFTTARAVEVAVR